MAKPQFTAEFARECFSYCPDLGILVWKTRPLHHFGRAQDMKTWNARWAGKAAGCINPTDGYRYVALEGAAHPGHRLIWLMETGAWPDPEVDHIDGDYSNNRWENLREATHPENMKNQKLPSDNTSGHIGIHWDKSRRKWKVDIGGRNLGRFPSFYEALLARWGAETALGYHKNHGRR